MGSPSPFKSFMSNHIDIHAFLLTISPKGDVTLDCQNAVVKWVKRNTHMHYLVAENGSSGKRHLHAVLIFKHPRKKSALHDNVWGRLVSPFHGTDSIGKHAVVITACPGNRWYDEYLKKESTAEVLLDNYEPEEALSFMPTEAEQEFLMAAGKRASGPAAPWLKQDIEAWAASSFENSPAGALTFLQHCMYVAETKVPLDDLRRLTSKSVMYWKYRNQIIVPTEREVWMLKQLTEGPAYDAPGSIRGEFSAAKPSI